VVIAKWQTARVIISLPNQSQRSSFAVIGYAEAGLQTYDITNNMSSAVTEYQNFGMQNLRPSNVKVIF